VLVPDATLARARAWNRGIRSPALDNIVQLAESVPDLSTLVTAVVAGGLVSTLER